MPTKRTHPEDRFQRSLVKEIRKIPGLVVFAVPNGGYRRAGEAMALKAQGVLAGVPDLCVVRDGRVLFIELKAPGTIKNKDERHKYCSEAQRHVQRKLREVGCPVVVTDDQGEALGAVLEYFYEG